MPDCALEAMLASAVKLLKSFTPESDVQAMYRCTAAAGAHRENVFAFLQNSFDHASDYQTDV